MHARPRVGGDGREGQRVVDKRQVTVVRGRVEVLEHEHVATDIKWARACVM